MSDFKLIKKIIKTSGGVQSRSFSLAGLTVGLFLLLASLQTYFYIQQIFREKQIRKSGYDYVSLSKVITNENMGKDNRFTEQEMQELKAHPLIEDVAPLIASRFKIVAGAGNAIPFSSDIFLESLDESFLDTVPPGFSWQEGQMKVPVLFSSDFLEMYNVFAPAYGLPQISEKTGSSINIQFYCEGPLGSRTFTAGILAFTDRVNSLLAPRSFIEWGNKNLAGVQETKASRVFIKTKDINNEELLRFLEKKQYRVNKEKTLSARSRVILRGIVAGIGILGLMISLLALLLFVYFLKLLLAQNTENIRLLLMLGYSPRWIAAKLSARFIPLYVLASLMALATVQFLYWIFRLEFFNSEVDHFPLLSFPVWTAAIVLTLFSFTINFFTARKIIYKML
ncbi:MAG: hypothetical protein N2747_05175 [Chitinophagaceae bacterium]|nr:hypothetical protein [Chitinophagaceae bacterium]